MIYLEFARRQRRWTQKQLGDLTRVEQHFISMIERGIGVPVPAQRERLAAALGVPAANLLDEVPDLIAPAAAENGRG